MVKQPKKPTIKRQPKKRGRCIQCRHAKILLDSNPHNPLLIQCEITHLKYPQSWQCQIAEFEEQKFPLSIWPNEKI